jgi:hypothetical protein
MLITQVARMCTGDSFYGQDVVRHVFDVNQKTCDRT